MNPESRQRVFFALRPGERERALLAQLARHCAERSGGRAVSADNAHVTLAFIGEVGPAQVTALRELGAGVPCAPFTLCFDRVQYRRRQQMVWIGCRETPGALYDLVSDLRAALAARGFRVESRPFLAHVTAVRRARRAPRTGMERVETRLRGFCLLRSRMDGGSVQYEQLDAWAHNAPKPDTLGVT